MLLQNGFKTIGDINFFARFGIETDVNCFCGTDKSFVCFEEFIEDRKGSCSDVFNREMTLEFIADSERGKVVGFAVSDNKNEVFVMENLFEAKTFAFDKVF